MEFSQEIADKICEALSTSSISLRKLCESPDLPGQTTVFKWLNSYPEFAKQYARAREAQADFIADEILEIADKSRMGIKTVVKETHTEITEGDMVDRSRLMIDARKWRAGKLAPKKYGDKIDLTSDNQRISTITPEMLGAIADKINKNAAG